MAASVDYDQELATMLRELMNKQTVRNKNYREKHFVYISDDFVVRTVRRCGPGLAQSLV